MPIPDHIFSLQDYLSLGDNNEENLRKIERFNPDDGKLVLNLLKSFKETSLAAFDKALSFIGNKWKLRDLW